MSSHWVPFELRGDTCLTPETVRGSSVGRRAVVAEGCHIGPEGMTHSRLATSQNS
jgi:hypothetical protein